MEENLLHHELETYRKALIALNTEASWGKRKTMDKTDIARRADMALETGNELRQRRLKIEGGS